MDKTTALRAIFAGAGVAAAGAMGMAAAFADDGTQQADLGGAARLVDGGTVQQWTVAGLRPSGDSIAYAAAGTLWEATATNTSVAGGNVPYIPGFTARSGADSYEVLWAVASPHGVNPSGLAPGQSSTGKMYFDVTSAGPDRVAFSDNGRDLAVWVTPPPTSMSDGGAPTAPYSPPSSYRGAQPAPAAATPAAPAAAPAPAGGSQGTPLPATGSQGTPLPAGTTPAPASPAPASTPAPASPAPASAPASTATPASPAPASAPASSSPAAPAPGSQGTPLTAPTTTMVPAPGA